jgi:tubulin polyglutamylase TTLL4
MGGSPLDQRIKGLLLSDIFHLVGVQVSPPLTSMSTSSNSSNSTNMKKATGNTTTSNKALFDVIMDPKKTHLENNHIEMFTCNEWDVIHQLEDENDRLGHFERIFPTSNATEMAKYATFFPTQRYNNALCAKWLHSKGRRRVTRAKSQESLLQQQPQPQPQPQRKVPIGGRKYSTHTTAAKSITIRQGVNAARLIPQSISSVLEKPPRTLI